MVEPPAAPLPLDSPRWSELKHAYGCAVSKDPSCDVPGLIARAQVLGPVGLGEPEAEPMFSLWSALCHQEDVYTASYAALPHLVRIVASAPEAVAFEVLLLVAAIAVGQHGDGAPAIPGDLEGAYRRAVDVELPAALKRLLDCPWDDVAMVAVLAAAAVSKGRVKAADALLGSVVCECQGCGEVSSLWDMVGEGK